MLVAHIVPVSYLGKVELGRFHLVLSHLCLESSEYYEFYRKRSWSGDIVILDNSYFEGKMVSEKELVKLGREISANVVVIPDRLIFKEAKEVAEGFVRICEEENVEFDLMGVCHGCDLDEFLKFYSYFSDSPGLGWIGLPARADFLKDFEWGKKSGIKTKDLGFSRVGVLDYLEGYDLVEGYKKHHLLGCLDPIELAYSKVFPFVVGCDSSVAYVESKQKKFFGNFGIEGEREGGTKGTINFSEKYDEKVAKIFEENALKMNRWAGYSF